MANTIGIQLEVDTKEVKDAGVQVDKFTKTIDGADDALEDLNMELDKTGKKAKQTGKGMKGAGASAQKASGGFKLAKNSSQQLGYQLQDVAVQAQMGASWFTIIGQQGSQLAGVLGPSGALLGAVIGIGAAVGGVLFAAFGSASDSSEKLLGRINALSKGFEDLSDEEKKYLAIIETKTIEEKQKEYDKLSKAIAETKKELMSANKVIDSRERSGSTNTRVQDRLERQKKSAQTLDDELVKLEAQFKVVSKEMENSSNEVDKLTNGLVKLSNQEDINLAVTLQGNDLMSIEKDKKRYEDINSALTKQKELLEKIEKTKADNAAKSALALEQRRIDTIVSNTEKELQTITNSNMSKIDLENTFYAQSISNLQVYREQKSLTDAEYNSAESLLYETHLGKLNAIEMAANQKRMADNQAMFSNIATGFSIFSDLQEASQVKKKQQLDADLRNSQNFTAAQIANKEKEAKSIFNAQKKADLASIASSTAVGIMGQIAQGNWVGAGAVGAAGALNYAKASSNTYSSPAGVNSSTTNAPPASQNTTNNNGGNTTTINFSGASGDSVETVIQYIKDQGILFDENSAQAQVLRS